MPYIDIKATKELTRADKTRLCERLNQAFAESSDKMVAGNIQYTVEGGCFIHFRGDAGQPSVNMEFHPGPLTPVDDYAPILDAFFPILTEELEAPKDRIYITVSEIRYWGFDGGLLGAKKKTE